MQFLESLKPQSFKEPSNFKAAGCCFGPCALKVSGLGLLFKGFVSLGFRLQAEETTRSQDQGSGTVPQNLSTCLDLADTTSQRLNP